MSIPVKTFSTKITDEYGGVFAMAFVAVRQFVKNSLDSGLSESCDGNYSITNAVEAITYKANYWYSDETKAAGKRSRPLKNEVDGGFSDVFEVDIDDPEVIQILASDQDHYEKILNAIKVDVIRRYR